MPRLDRGIQYAVGYRLHHHCLGVLDRPVKPGDDAECVERLQPLHAADLSSNA